jgi:hypothetical protein
MTGKTMRLVEPSDGEAIPPRSEREDEDSWVTYYQHMNEESEELVVDPFSGGMKGSKRARFDLLPFDALWRVAEHFGAGGKKYEDRNWERGYNWSLSFAALHRHLALWWNGENEEPLTEADEIIHHLDAVVFHALALRAFTLRQIGTDDRPEVPQCKKVPSTRNC